MNELALIGRESLLFDADLQEHTSKIDFEVKNSNFLVIGGAGTIGQAVVKEIFKRSPKKLHVVDIAENNMVELVRDLRSSFGYIEGEFKTFTIDIDSIEFDSYIAHEKDFDYVLNLSALKHVRNEKDPFTLMRMIRVNILNTLKSMEQTQSAQLKKYFCVSTDKATNPVNMMGASKNIMELFLMKYSKDIKISTARFANVAFSDGSLLHSFKMRIEKKQPLVAPNDIKRYFLLPQEAGELCLMSCILGENRDIFFPKIQEQFQLISFQEIAINFLQQLGLKPHICSTEQEARDFKINGNEWPCYFFESDTTGEKSYEEFFSDQDSLDLDRFQNLGIIKNEIQYSEKNLENFLIQISKMLHDKKWTKSEIVKLFKSMVPDFHYEDKEKYLESKM